MLTQTISVCVRVEAREGRGEESENRAREQDRHVIATRVTCPQRKTQRTKKDRARVREIRDRANVRKKIPYLK